MAVNADEFLTHDFWVVEKPAQPTCPKILAKKMPTTEEPEQFGVEKHFAESSRNKGVNRLLTVLAVAPKRPMAIVGGFKAKFCTMGFLKHCILHSHPFISLKIALAQFGLSMKARECMSKKADPKSNGEGRRQIFSFDAPSAVNVTLVGNFTHWMERPIKLRKGKQGVWETSIILPRGLHHYHFLVDGECRGDPKSMLRESNSYGGLDDVRQVS